MGKTEALQGLSYYQSALFIKKTEAFDYSILEIPRKELISDAMLGENKQRYKTDSGHLLYELLRFMECLNDLYNCAMVVSKANLWTGNRKRFDYIIKKLDPMAIAVLDSNFFWF